jgi:hypothetical protein
MVAAGAGHPEVVATLLAHGADPDLMDRDGRTAAERARDSGYDEVVRLLETSAPAGRVGPPRDSSGDD